jgi:hypothetical protein
MAAGGELREFHFIELQLDRHGIECAPAANILLQRRDIARVDQIEFREALERGVEVGDLLARELDLIGGRIGRKRLSAAIQDESAVRRDRFDANAIALRQLREVLIAHDLQPCEARHHGPDCEHHDHGSCDRSAFEQSLLGNMVLDANGRHDARSATYRLRRVQVSSTATTTGHSSVLDTTGSQRIQVVTAGPMMPSIQKIRNSYSASSMNTVSV